MTYPISAASAVSWTVVADASANSHGEETALRYRRAGGLPAWVSTCGENRSAYIDFHFRSDLYRHGIGGTWRLIAPGLRAQARHRASGRSDRGHCPTDRSRAGHAECQTLSDVAECDGPL